MAGSLQWFVYESDEGKKYAVRLDESNAVLMNFPRLKADGSNAPDGALPKGLRMRYCTWQSYDGQMKRKLYAPTNINERYLEGGEVTLATLNGNAALTKTGRIFSRIGERFLLIKVKGAGAGKDRPDTGLIDGDDET